MHELRQDHPLAYLLKAASLKRSTYYACLKASQASDKYELVKEVIKETFDRHKGRYGYRRIWAELRQLGHALNHKTVQRLMNELGLKSLVRPKKYQSYKGEAGRTAPNILKRRFVAQRPNEKWVTDVTEFKVGGEKLYFSPVMDLFNGEIVAHETATRPTFELVSSMLKKALLRLRPSDKTILHSDQGWHYQMPAYRQALRQRRIRQSMSRKGNCHDNAAMESFFAVLKSEYFYLNKFTSVDELRQGLADYIHYYNHDRIKLKLGRLSPVQYRIQSAQPRRT